MAIVINDIIDADDYNSIRNKIVKVLNDDGVDQKIGYGRAISSVAKSAGDIISASDMTALFTDLEKIRNHHTGFATNNESFSWGYSDGLNAPDSAEIVGVFAADVGPTDSQDATADTDEGFIDFDGVASNAVTFAGNFPTSFPGAGSFSVDDLVSDVRTTSWNGTISHQVTIRWSSADQRRYFFNAGGRIRFAASLTGGNSVAGDQTATYPSSPEYQKDEIWQTMLNVMETIDFGRDRTTQPGTASGSPAAAIGNYQLTNSDQVIFTKDGSGVYSENQFKIEARNVDTRSVRFTISYIDADIGDDRIADAYNYRVDENVTGTITSVIKSVTPSSFLGIAAPAFVADTTLEGSTPSTSYSLAASETEVNEGGSFDVTLTTTGLSNGTQVPYTITGIDTNDIGGTALTGNFQINGNSATLTINVSEDFTNDGGDETFSLTLDNGLGGTAEVIIHDTSLATSFGGWPAGVPQTNWGTKSHTVSNTGGSASVTADFTVTNTGNGVVTVASRTFDGATASPTTYTGQVTYSNTVGTVTVEARYNASTQNSSGGGTNPSGTYTSGTYYSIAVGDSLTFTWTASDSTASTTTSSSSMAAGVNFEIRISDDNSTITRQSATGLFVDLDAFYSETAQNINSPFMATVEPVAIQLDGDERIGFKLLSNGETERYEVIYSSPDYVLTPQTASVIDWLPASLQGTGNGANYEWNVTKVSESNSTLAMIYDGPATRVPATGDTYNASTNYWEVVQDFYGTYADVNLVVNGTEIFTQRYQPAANAQTRTSIFVNGKTYYRGGSQTGYSYTQRWGYYYETSEASFGTWYNGANALTVYSQGTDIPENGTAQVNLKIRKVGAGTAYDVNQSVNINADLTDATATVSLPTMYGTADSNGLSGSCSVSLNWTPTTVDVSAFGNPGNDSPPGTWLAAGSASDYQVKYDYVDGTTGNGSISGPGTGWLTANSNYTWRVSDSGSDPDASTMSGTLYVRRTSDNVIVASESVSMNANNNP